ncbi:hypothetical protein VUJ46_00105 [Chryseobacterium sp. MYb264]|uniref:hypothetical protein n=1 Tax=Chryseobacterium sp. MYb264 TaxID=2745153 RepID=UPI002E0D90BC|nr:hypothetical protein VUJ46_00105 [Chryseobacterium sp. MYb264]
MVKKSVLDKLSDRELQKYIQKDSQFTPEAIQIAFEILQERGNIFSQQEKKDIAEIIQNRKNVEQTKLQEEQELWQEHLTDDPAAVALYSRSTILVISFLFGTIPGSILLFLNFIKIKKYIPAILTLAFGILYFFIQNYVISALDLPQDRSRYDPRILIIGLGSISLMIISVAVLPKKLIYKSASFIFPIILAMVMLALMYFDEQGLFSNYLIPRTFSIIKIILVN